MLSLACGSIHRTANGVPVHCFQSEVLYGISVKAPHFGVRGCLCGALCQQGVYAQALAHLLLQQMAACLPRRLVVVERREIFHQLLSILGLSARVFVRLYLVIFVVLLHRFEVKGRQNIVQRFLDRVWAYAEVGIAQFQSGGIYVVFQFHLEPFGHIIQHVAQRSGIFVFKALRVGAHCSHQRQ